MKIKSRILSFALSMGVLTGLALPLAPVAAAKELLSIEQTTFESANEFNAAYQSSYNKAVFALPMEQQATAKLEGGLPVIERESVVNASGELYIDKTLDGDMVQGESYAFYVKTTRPKGSKTPFLTQMLDEDGNVVHQVEENVNNGNVMHWRVADGAVTPFTTALKYFGGGSVMTVRFVVDTAKNEIMVAFGGSPSSANLKPAADEVADTFGNQKFQISTKGALPVADAKKVKTIRFVIRDYKPSAPYGPVVLNDMAIYRGAANDTRERISEVPNFESLDTVKDCYQLRSPGVFPYEKQAKLTCDDDGVQIQRTLNTGNAAAAQPVYYDRSVSFENSKYILYAKTTQFGSVDTGISLLAGVQPILSVIRGTDGTVGYNAGGVTGSTDNVKYLNNQLDVKITVDFSKGMASVALRGDPTSGDAGGKDDEGYAILAEGVEVAGLADRLRFTVGKNGGAGSAMRMDSLRIYEQETMTDFDLDVESLTPNRVLKGQSDATVMTGLELPRVLGNGTQVTWSAQPEDIVDLTTGSIRLPEERTAVVLTAALTGSGEHEGKSATKIFAFTVCSVHEADYGTVEILRMDQADFNQNVTEIPFDEPLKQGIYTIYITTTQFGATDSSSIIETTLNSADDAFLTMRQTNYGDMQQRYAYDGLKSIILPYAAADVNATIQYRNRPVVLKYVLNFDEKKITSAIQGAPSKIDGAQLPDSEAGFSLFTAYRADASYTMKEETLYADSLKSIRIAAETPYGDDSKCINSVRVLKSVSDPLEADLASLTMERILNGQPAKSVTGDLKLDSVLPYGSAVVWTSEPAGIIGADGAMLTRPAKDTYVTLTSSVSDARGQSAEKEFVVRVKSASAEADDLAFDKAVLDPGVFNGGDKTILPLKGERGSTISWATSDSAVLSIAADGCTVTAVNVDETKTVTLTAALTLGNISATKAFQRTVVPKKNLSVGKPAQSDSVYSDAYNASKATDGIATTRWATPTTSAYPNWIYVDMGEATNVNQMIVSEYKSRVKDYMVQCSDDAETWSDIYTGTAPDDGNKDRSFTAEFETTAARYFRLYIQSGYQSYPTLYEVEFYHFTPARPETDAITMDMVTDDPAENVTAIKQLPQMLGDRQITWVSSDETIIDLKSNTLTKPRGADTAVRLIADLEGAGSKEFVLNVKGEKRGLHTLIQSEFEGGSYDDRLIEVSGGAQTGAGLALDGGSSMTAAVAGSLISNDGAFHIALSVTQKDAAQIEILGSDGNVLFTDKMEGTGAGSQFKHGGGTAKAVQDNGSAHYFIEFDFNLPQKCFSLKVNGAVLAEEESLRVPGGIKAVRVKNTGNAMLLVNRVETSMARADVKTLLARQIKFACFSDQNPNMVKDSFDLSDLAVGGVTFAWSSSAPEIVNTTGVVTNPKQDGLHPVTITGRASFDGVSAEILIPIQVVGIMKDSLLYGKTIRSNAETVGSNPPENAIDGSSLTSYLFVSAGKPIEMDVNLGEVSRIGKIELKEAAVDGAYEINEYKILGSNDLINWTEITSGGSVGESKVYRAAQAFRYTYLRFAFAGDEAKTLGLREIDVRATAGDESLVDVEYDLEAITMPQSVILSSGFDIPLKGCTGSTVTVASSDESVINVTKSGESYRIEPIRTVLSSKSATVTVTCTDPAERSASVSKFYTVEPTVKPSVPSSNGGGGGGGSAFGGNVPPVVPMPLPTQPPGNDPEDTAFPDITESYAWAKESITKLKEMNVVSGDAAGNFNPGDSILREEFIKMLVTAMDLTLETDSLPFVDVDQTAWYYPYVATAYRNGIVNGVSEQAFGIGSTVTRQDMAVMIDRILGGGDVAPPLRFADRETVAPYAQDAVARMSEAGILKGDGERFYPENNSTRAEVAKVICGLLQERD